MSSITSCETSSAISKNSISNSIFAAPLRAIARSPKVALVDAAIVLFVATMIMGVIWRLQQPVGVALPFPNLSQCFAIYGPTIMGLILMSIAGMLHLRDTRNRTKAAELDDSLSTSSSPNDSQATKNEVNSDISDKGVRDLQADKAQQRYKAALAARKMTIYDLPKDQ